MTAVFTGLGTYYLDKTSTERIGIVPDIEVKPTIEGLRNGLDEVLVVALDCAHLATTTIKDKISDFEVDIIPNPTSNYFRISCEEDEWISLKIYNTYGHKVLHFNEVKDDFVNITHIPNGVYLFI